MATATIPTISSDRTIDAYRLTRITDGDTPFVEMPIRMLSIDTPEVHYPGSTRPSEHDGKLRQLGDDLRAGRYPRLPRQLARYFGARLDERAGTRQLEQGERSMREYERMLHERMARPTGSERKLFVRAAAEPFEGHGRLLAYVAPMYDAEERTSMSLYDRRTFNFQLVEEGWAAPMLIWPSLPKPEDLDLFRAAIRTARLERRGHRADPKTLNAYEFRFAVKVTRGEAELPERFCADLRTRKLYSPAFYLSVKEEDRVFIWPRDVAKARTLLSLVDA